jgi:hypothetical protein
MPAPQSGLGTSCAGMTEHETRSVMPAKAGIQPVISTFAICSSGVIVSVTCIVEDSPFASHYWSRIAFNVSASNRFLPALSAAIHCVLCSILNSFASDFFSFFRFFT